MGSDDIEASSNRPYLIRAIRDWAIDNHLTPQLLVNATVSGVEVPSEFVENGQIVLNVSPHAADNLDMGNDFISFSARFQGVSRSVICRSQQLLPYLAARAVRACLLKICPRISKPMRMRR